MDWRRAKTIFIISFILLDLFLAAQINQMVEQKSNYLRTDKITEDQIHDLLEANQIQMTVTPPDSVTQIPALLAKITPISGWDYNERWEYHQSLSPPIVFKNRIQFESYLREKLSFFKDYTYSKEDSSQNQLVYIQRAHQHPIFDGKIASHIKDGKVHRIEALHFQIKESVNIEFIPFNNALYNLMTRESLPKGAKISDVELGYRSMYYPNPNEVILVPVWRFTVNGKHHDIYATTNNLDENK